MLYKTILLELIQSQPELNQRLKDTRLHLAAIELYSRELRNLHLEWIQELTKTKPTMDEATRKSAAAELALAQWKETHLQNGSVEMLLAEVKASVQ